MFISKGTDNASEITYSVGYHAWIYHHYGTTPLRVSMRCFQRGLTQEERSTVNVGSTFP